MDHTRHHQDAELDARQHLHVDSATDDVLPIDVEPTAAERRHEGVLFRGALALKRAFRSLLRR